MSLYVTNRRIYRTPAGELVFGDHPDAAFLAYAAGDSMSEEEAIGLGLKAAERLADKTGAKPADKSGKE